MMGKNKSQRENFQLHFTLRNWLVTNNNNANIATFLCLLKNLNRIFYCTRSNSCNENELTRDEHCIYIICLFERVPKFSSFSISHHIVIVVSCQMIKKIGIWLKAIWNTQENIKENEMGWYFFFFNFNILEHTNSRNDWNESDEDLFDMFFFVSLKSIIIIIILTEHFTVVVVIVDHYV